MKHNDEDRGKVFKLAKIRISEVEILIFRWQGCSYNVRIRKNAFAYTFGPKNMGRLYHNSDGFLMLCVQNVCVEPILISKSNFDRICDDVCITSS